MFKKSYSFVNDIRKDEIAATEAKLNKIQKIKGKEDFEPELRAELTTLKAEAKKNAASERQLDVKSKIRQSNKERVMGNKAPYFYNKKEINNMVLAKKLDAMGNKSKIEKYMSKKRIESEGKQANRVKEMQAKKFKKMQALGNL